MEMRSISLARKHRALTMMYEEQASTGEVFEAIGLPADTEIQVILSWRDELRDLGLYKNAHVLPLWKFRLKQLLVLGILVTWMILFIIYVQPENSRVIGIPLFLCSFVVGFLLVHIRKYLQW